MISRRRMVFQLTALLDLLLVVLFAQYMETQEQAQRAIRYQEMLRKRAVSEMKQTDQFKQDAVADLKFLNDQLERLTAERDRLRNALQVAGITPTTLPTTQSADLAAIREIFRDRLNISPDALEPYLAVATPEERQRLLDSLRGLKDGSPEKVAEVLRAASEFGKLSSLWEIHLSADGAVRLRMGSGGEPVTFKPQTPVELSTRLMEAAGAAGEPRSLVVVLFTSSGAPRAQRQLVVNGMRDAIQRLRFRWGTPKRIELAILGPTATPTTQE